MNGPFLALTDGISYFPASREPLSSDLFRMETERGTVLFDVGNGDRALAAACAAESPIIVLSHFHADHIGNMPMLSPQAIYLSKETQKHTVPGTVVTEATEIADGITVLPFPNSHAKGSLALRFGDCLFIGDGLYPRELNGKDCYNTGLLKEEIALLEKLAPDRIIVSHRDHPIVPAAAALTLLKRIYGHRKPSETYIIDTPFSEG